MAVNKPKGDNARKGAVKKRTQIKDLPEKKKELTAEEAKKVRGGASAGVGTGQDHDALVFRAEPPIIKTGIK